MRRTEYVERKGRTEIHVLIYSENLSGKYRSTDLNRDGSFQYLPQRNKKKRDKSNPVTGRGGPQVVRRQGFHIF
jgi:hypothetical protein